jgi:predicted RNase H-like nuclease
MTNNDKALDAFLAKKAEIDAQLKRLQDLSDNMFEAHPDEVNYGHVGSLGYMAEKLKEVTDFMFNEGE